MDIIKHIVIDMDESMVQRCIICGEVISDYTNTMKPKGDPMPKGFPSGDVYVIKGKGFTTSSTVLKENETFKNCNN